MLKLPLWIRWTHLWITLLKPQVFLTQMSWEFQNESAFLLSFIPRRFIHLFFWFFFLLQNTHKMSFIFESRFSLAENMFLLLIMKIFPDLFQVSSSFTGEKMLHLRLSGGCFKSFRSYSILEDQNGWLPRNDDVDRTQEFLAVFFFFGRYIWSFARRKALAMNDLWCYFNRVIFGSPVRCSQSFFFFSFKK